MTEAEWWAATGRRQWPDPLLHWLFFFAVASDRKLRLCSVACCRIVEYLAGGAPFPFLLRSLEALADGQEDERRLRRAFESVATWHRERGYPSPAEDAEVATQAAILAAGSPFRDRAWHESRQTYPYPCYVVEEVARALDSLRPPQLAGPQIVRVIHDIFGPLPFRDVPVDPRWLTSDVVALARGAYDEKAFDRMPILADALQDAGCDNDEILTHCRAADWEHVRGCWVVDLLLGKQWREGPTCPVAASPS